MKSIVILAIICGVIGFSKALTADERKAMEQKLVGECSKKESVSDADLAELAAHKMPTSKAGQCFHACMMETTGIAKDGKVSAENALQIVSMVFEGDEHSIKMLKEIIGECKDITDADRCELAVKVMKCAAGASEKRGVDVGDLL